MHRIRIVAVVALLALVAAACSDDGGEPTETVSARLRRPVISAGAWGGAVRGVRYDSTFGQWHASPDSGRKGFDRGAKLDVRYVTMTEYDSTLGDMVEVAFARFVAPYTLERAVEILERMAEER